MNPLQIRWTDKGEWGSIRCNEEHPAITGGGMQMNACKDGFQGVVQRHHKEIVTWFEVSEGVDDQCATGPQHAPNVRKGFAGQQMRWRRIAQKCIEDHGVVLLLTSIQEMASVINRDMKLICIQAEKFRRNRDDGRINLSDIDPRAMCREIHRHNPNAKANAQNIIDICHIDPREACEKISKLRHALFPLRVVSVLRQKIIKVKAEGPIIWSNT